MKLTNTSAAALKPGVILRDKQRPGLYGLGRKTGTRFIYHSEMRNSEGKRQGVKVTLGRVPDMTVEDARIAAGEAARKIGKGINPNAPVAEDVSAKELLESLAKGINPVAKHDKTLTLNLVLEHHLSARKLAVATTRDYRRQLTDEKLNTLLELADHHPRDITPDIVASIRDRLVERGPTMAANALRVLKALMNTAMKIDFGLTRNPVDAVDIPAVAKRQIAEMNLESLAAYVGKLAQKKRMMWTVLVTLGVRRETLLEMKRADVDIDGKTMRLSHLKRGDTTRIIPIGDRLTALLKDWLELPSHSVYLWPGLKSNSRMVQVRRTDGSPASPHELRHWYSTLAIEAGVPHEEKEMLLCHSLKGVADVYSHPHLLVEALRPHQQSIEDKIFEKAPKLFSHQ